jgi:DNA polymerase elongation subunit (family B)
MSYINAHLGKNSVNVWERRDSGERELVRYDIPYYFYAEDKEGKHDSLFGKKASRFDFGDREAFTSAISQCRNNNIELFESDIQPEYKILAQHYYGKSSPNLNITYLDIEVDYDLSIGYSSIENPYAPVNSIAMYHSWSNRMVVYAIPPDGNTDVDMDEMMKNLDDIAELPTDCEVEVILCKTEGELLAYFLEETADSDGLCGWNSEFFDIPYLGKRLEMLGPSWFHQMSFEFAPRPRWKEIEIFGKVQYKLELGGRLSIDYMELFKKFEMSKRQSYKLDYISNEIIPDMAKLEYSKSLAKMYREDFTWFIRYNLRDTECLRGFEQKLGYVALANEMYHEATGLYKNILGTIKLAELSLINYCHRNLNVIAPDVPKHQGGGDDEKARGAFVLKPKAGKHDNIGSIDINSLYPSAIRSINISPETLIGQFTCDVDDFEALAADNDSRELSMVMEDTGETITHKASTWKEILKMQRWAVSGYGTVFTQEQQGIIPAILENWYATRKEFNKKKEAAYEAGDKRVEYYDRMQYCYKIKLNSLYGALLNSHFRFYDPRMGESTTGTGRAILQFMCGRVNEILCDEFDPGGEAIVYGDTDSCYFATFAQDSDEATVIADSVADLVNASFQEFMQRSFLCTDQFDDIIKAGREVVASSGIFVTPKRYALKLVNLDGNPCNKLKVMGLDTKKTILPTYIQDALNKFIERYLDGEPWDVIASDIVEFKDDMEHNRDIATLGLPKGCNKVEYYARELQLDADARVPGHVRAALYYNECREKYEDNLSPRVTSGMRVRVFYLENPQGKTKSIGLPVDLDEVPQWFYDHIDVNVTKQIEKLVDNPLQNVLKAIGKKPPSRRELFINNAVQW